MLDASATGEVVSFMYIMYNTVRKLWWWRLATVVSVLLFVGSAIVWLQNWLPTMVSGLLFVCAIVIWGVAETKGARLIRSLQREATAESNQAFDSLYGKSPVAYLLIHENGNLELTNAAALHLLGIVRSEVSEYNFYDFLSRKTDVDTAMVKSKLERGITITEVEVPLHTTAGDLVWVLLSMFEPDNRQQRLISLVNVTDQKAVDTAKSEFVALATHQLRTPIAAIRWNVELLQKNMRETATEKQSKYLTKIDRNVNRMLSLINDFLSVSKLEMGTFTAEAEQVEFNTYLREILDEFEEKITSKQLVMKHIAEPEIINVKIDRRLFHIISSNLLSNAVKYTNEGGAVTVTARATGGSLLFSVADSGIGIPENELPQLFGKFYRASNAQQQVTEGTGLGLYVVKQSVEILGGTITVQSAENQGTTFSVQLPSVVVGTA